MKTLPLHDKLLLLWFLLLLPLLSYSQRVENISFSTGTIQDGKSEYFIVYDLVAPYDSIPCQVKVKLTANGKTFYLKELKGDVGNLVYPGLKKQIVWDYIEELVHFNGEIDLNIEMIPSLKVPVKIKRHKPLLVSLAPIYETKKTYAVKLFQGGKEVSRLNDVLLIENSFPVQLPKKTKVKSKYQIAITDGDRTYFSNTFKVKPRISRGWIILPVLAVPTYLLINQYLEDNKPLPGPPTIN